jgi:hypothetical protein
MSEHWKASPPLVWFLVLVTLAVVGLLAVMALFILY